jgi:hypothetical protein
LGRDSAVFTNATSNYLSSEISIGSLVTGSFYTGGGEFTLGPSGSGSDGILGILIDDGRRVQFYSNFFRCQVRGIQLCHDDVFFAGSNVNSVARDYLVYFMPIVISRTARHLAVRVLSDDVSDLIPFNPVHHASRALWDGFLAEIKSSSAPGSAHFVHSLLPHQPYEFNRNGDRVHDGLGEANFKDFDRMSVAYEQQVMFVDTLLGEFINKLKTEGLYDHSLIIVTGDHGPRSLALGEAYNGFDKEADFPIDLSGLIPRVPLIIHGPNIEPQVSSVDFQHIDFMPTVLDLLQQPPRPGSPGTSAFAPDRPVREKVFFGIPSKGKPGESVPSVYDESKDTWKKTLISPE